MVLAFTGNREFRENIPSADELAKRMTDALAEELNVTQGEEVTVLVNGFRKHTSSGIVSFQLCSRKGSS